MSSATASAETFASGRYSKRKRAQVTYHLEELEVSGTESDYESLSAKKRKTKTHKPNSTPKALPKRQVFPFMQLPAEIRNQIYTYALTCSGGINFIGGLINKRRTTHRISARYLAEVANCAYYKSITKEERTEYTHCPVLVPSILAANKQVYHEAIDVLYSNEFVFKDSVALYSFMINLGPSGAHHVKNVRVLSWVRGRATKAYNQSCFAVLAWATNLTTLRIEGKNGWHSSTSRLADRFYRDAFAWLEAIGVAKGKLDAGVDMLKLGDYYFKSPWSNLTVSQQSASSHDEEELFFKTTLRLLLGAQRDRILGVTHVKQRAAKKADA